MIDFKIIEVDPEDDAFVSFYAEREADIEKFFPHYSEEDAERGFVLLLMVEDVIIGALVYQTKGQEVHVDLDYVIPFFRNKGVGKKLFEVKSDDFKNTGFKTIVTLTDHPEHIDYLLKVGFEPTEIHPDRYELEINQ